MILYIKRDFEKNHLITTRETTELKSTELYLKQLAIINLMDIEGYKRSVKKTLNIKSCIPLRMNENLNLFKIKTYDGCEFHINYNSLLEVFHKDEEIFLIFKNFNSIILNCSKRSFKNQLEKCIKINRHIDEQILNAY